MELEQARLAIKVGDVRQAEGLLRELAKSGNPEAQLLLGRLYEDDTGSYGMRNFAEARYWYELASQAGLAEAMLWLGLLDEGTDATLEVRETSHQLLADARAKLEIQARAGDNHAEFLLGKIYLYGWGVPPNPQYALRHLETAAKSGQAEYLYEIGHRLIDGDDLAKDLSRGSQFLIAAAEKGWVDAQYLLGVYCATGQCGFQVNPVEAIRWYSMAADQGCGEAQWNLGRMYEAGHGVTQELAIAEKYYSDSAKNGYWQAIERESTAQKVPGSK